MDLDRRGAEADKHILRLVEPVRDNLRYGRRPLWMLTDPPWRSDAVGGGHIIDAA